VIIFVAWYRDLPSYGCCVVDLPDRCYVYCWCQRLRGLTLPIVHLVVIDPTPVEFPTHLVGFQIYGSRFTLFVDLTPTGWFIVILRLLIWLPTVGWLALPVTPHTLLPRNLGDY